MRERVQDFYEMHVTADVTASLLGFRNMSRHEAQTMTTTQLQARIRCHSLKPQRTKKLMIVQFIVAECEKRLEEDIERGRDFAGITTPASASAPAASPSKDAPPGCANMASAHAASAVQEAGGGGDSLKKAGAPQSEQLQTQATSAQPAEAAPSKGAPPGCANMASAHAASAVQEAGGGGDSLEKAAAPQSEQPQTQATGTPPAEASPSKGAPPGCANMASAHAASAVQEAGGGGDSLEKAGAPQSEQPQTQATGTPPAEASPSKGAPPGCANMASAHAASAVQEPGGGGDSLEKAGAPQSEQPQTQATGTPPAEASPSKGAPPGCANMASAHTASAVQEPGGGELSLEKTKANTDLKQKASTHVALAAAAGALVPANPAASSSSCAAPGEQMVATDVTQHFLVTGDGEQDAAAAVQSDLRPNKVRFLDAKLIIPAISLKKMKQALNGNNGNAARYVAALGIEDVRMYKIYRPRLSAMCMGDFLTDVDGFWQHASRQLQDKKAGALYLFDQFEGNLASAPCPKHLAAPCLQELLYSFMVGDTSQPSMLVQYCTVIFLVLTSLYLALEVLESMPLNMRPEEGSHLYIFTIPSNSPLGTNEKDFSSVSVKKFSFQEHGLEDTDDDLFYAAVGKLGILSSGLLNIADWNKSLSAADIKDARLVQVKKNLELKRTELGIL